VKELLDAVVEQVPPPHGDPAAPARALIFDSVYDTYRGVVTYVRVMDGRLNKRERMVMMSTQATHETLELGVISPEPIPTDGLGAGEVGYVITGLKDVSELRVGDTLTTAAAPAAEPLPGYKDVKPMVFAGLFPTDSDDYPELRDALERLKLNDAALMYEPETSQALGFGFRCGFLGLLHMEIVRERLEREFDLDLLVTAPNVAYRVQEKNGDWVEVHNPAEFPREIEEVEEPYVAASIIVPKEHVGAVMELNNDRRGTFGKLEYLSPERVHLTYELPLAEIVLDYYDQLKSRTRGYASFDYDLAGFKPGELVRVDVLVGGEPVDALSLIVHRDFAYDRGRLLVDKLREEIPRQMFDIPIQAAIGARVIARETVKAKRKDVLAKCYGGDISRKRKLLEKQKAGKKRMKQVGSVEVPQEAFLAVLNIGQGGKS
jgi:GTP-binding protein LepA